MLNHKHLQKIPLEEITTPKEGARVLKSHWWMEIVYKCPDCEHTEMMEQLELGQPYPVCPIHKKPMPEYKEIVYVYARAQDWKWIYGSTK